MVSGGPFPRPPDSRARHCRRHFVAGSMEFNNAQLMLHVARIAGRIVCKAEQELVYGSTGARICLLVEGWIFAQKCS